jgi:hypothetical protein
MYGLLTDFGASPFEFDNSNSKSFYVKLTTSIGEKIIWGVGLKDALNKSNCKVGDNVSVIHNGKEPVNVPITKKDESGKKVTSYITKQRNSFIIKPKKNKVPLKKVAPTSRKIQTIQEEHHICDDSQLIESIKHVLWGMLIGSTGVMFLYAYSIA